MNILRNKKNMAGYTLTDKKCMLSYLVEHGDVNIKERINRITKNLTYFGDLSNCSPWKTIRSSRETDHLLLKYYNLPENLNKIPRYLITVFKREKDYYINVADSFKNFSNLFEIIKKSKKPPINVIKSILTHETLFKHEALLEKSFFPYIKMLNKEDQLEVFNKIKNYNTSIVNKQYIDFLETLINTDKPLNELIQKNSDDYQLSDTVIELTNEPTTTISRELIYSLHNYTTMDSNLKFGIISSESFQLLRRVLPPTLNRYFCHSDSHDNKMEQKIDSISNNTTQLSLDFTFTIHGCVSIKELQEIENSMSLYQAILPSIIKTTFENIILKNIKIDTHNYLDLVMPIIDKCVYDYKYNTFNENLDNTFQNQGINIQTKSRISKL